MPRFVVEGGVKQAIKALVLEKTAEFAGTGQRDLNLAPHPEQVHVGMIYLLSFWGSRGVAQQFVARLV